MNFGGITKEERNQRVIISDIIKVLGFVLSLVGIYLQTNKNILGWYFHLVSNACWISMMLPDGQWVMVMSSVTYSALNVYGIFKWKKTNKD